MTFVLGPVFHFGITEGVLLPFRHERPHKQAKHLPLDPDECPPELF